MEVPLAAGERANDCTPAALRSENGELIVEAACLQLLDRHQRTGLDGWHFSID